MADEIVSTEAAQQVDQAAAVKAELDQQMAISLNLNNPPAAAPVSTDTNTPEPSTGEPVVVPVSEPATVNDPFGFLKEKFQYQSHEDAIKEIEELRAFKAAPRPEEFRVPDDESARILKALAAGKKEEVWKHLDHEMRIERLVNTDVTKETAADIVKLGMQLKYKDLTSDEINYRFNKQFAVPPKPVQSIEEDESDYQQRVNAWQEVVTDKQMELMIEAKLAKPELQNARTNFTYPDIVSDTPVDEGYLQYKQMLEEQPKIDEQIKAVYKAMTPKAIETKIHFKDEANKIDFQFQFEPNAEKFSKATDVASNLPSFFEFFKKPDGTPDREKLVDAIYFAMDKENYLMSALNQAKNAAIKANLPDNSQPGMTRQNPVIHEPNELDQHMRFALKGYGGY